jgi:NAD(P)-dependent dehydrogenase (short-subunit alcohol dehydrogenase family)
MNKVWLITGANSGFGRALTHAAIAAGDVVAATARNTTALDDLIAAYPGQVDALPLDVTDISAIDATVADIISRHGRIDVLVNNAGISPLYSKLTDVTEELWDKVIAVNLKGPFRLSALVGERMAAGDGGAIINVSSTGSVRPTGDIVPYAAAKAGVNAMTVGLADALGPNVRVNAIMPGPFLTSISRSWDMEVLADRTKTHPLGRAGEAREIVGAALYFAGDASSFTTGAVLTVDGGAQWSNPARGAARS